jgi:hypothetical protein
MVSRLGVWGAKGDAGETQKGDKLQSSQSRHWNSGKQRSCGIRVVNTWPNVDLHFCGTTFSEVGRWRAWRGGKHNKRRAQNLLSTV